jgi:hypothetical protein
MELRTLVTLSCWLACAGIARAQEFGPWRVVGRFASEFEKGSTREPTPVEKQLAQMLPGKEGPDLSQTFKGMGEEVVRWHDLGGKQTGKELDVGVIDLDAVAPPPASTPKKNDNAICYLYRRIDATSDVELPVLMGSDDGLRVWHDGTLIVDIHVPRVINVRDNFVVLRLHAGANHLFVKVTNAAGPYLFQMSAWSKVSQQAVNAAIDRGVDFVQRTQLIDGTWGYAHHFGGGHAAFAAYTLLKCGVRKDHPVVRMALEAAEHRGLDTTYATSALILALSATGDEREHERIESACRQLIAWQEKLGLWGYPMYPDDPIERPVDLSCTLFAALALRAASHAGFQTPDAVWKRMAEGTLRCREREHEVEALAGARERVAGFSYRLEEGATGSMTTAGLSVLAIVEEQTDGRLPPATRADIASARDRGWAWVVREMTWTTNPGARAGHHYYWIYGIERAATLLERDKIGAVDWYQDGAAFLLKAQKDDGSWNTSGAADEEYMDTLLALLFLKRATQSTTGESARAAKVAETSEADAEVSLRATGDAALTVWVTNLRNAAIDALGGAEVDVAKIDYFARRAGETAEPVLLASVSGAVAKPTDLARLALQHRFDSGGTWLVSAKVSLRAPEVVLKSPELEVRVAGTVGDARLQYAGDAARDLLIGAQAKFTASSSRGDKLLPANVADGRFSTSWRCDVNDEQPWLRIAIDRPMKADRVLLSHAGARANANEARAAKVELLVNGKDRFSADMNADVLAKTAVALGQTLLVKQLEIRIVATRDRKLGEAGVGFSEVELQRGR